MESKWRSSAFLSPPQNFSSSSTFSYFSQQSINAAYSYPNQNHGVREAMQRQMEKERIRMEIIAEEIVRKRVLEEEVRREMMMEREIALRLGSHAAMRLEPRLPLLTNFEGKERFGFGVCPRREVELNGFETLPFQREPGVAGTGIGNSSSVTLQEIKGPASDVNKDKVIILARPSVNSANLKRKATPPPGGADVECTSVGLKKHKTKDDLSCALCHLTATSEQALNEHLLGKKHKAREKGLVTQRVGFGVGPSPQKTILTTTKTIKVPGITNTPSSKKNDDKVEGKSSSAKADETATQKPLGVKNILSRGKKNPVEKKENGGATTSQITPATAKPKSKFRYRCEICEVEAHSQKVMNAHKRGKKHMAKLLKLNQAGERVHGKNSTQNVVTEEKKEFDVPAEEIKKKTVVEEVESIKGWSVTDMPLTESKDIAVGSVGR